MSQAVIQVANSNSSVAVSSKMLQCGRNHQYVQDQTVVVLPPLVPLWIPAEGLAILWLAMTNKKMDCKPLTSHQVGVIYFDLFVSQ